MPKPGYKMSACLKAGIKVTPIGIGTPGSVCQKFHIRVTKISSKTKQEIEVKGKDPYKEYHLKPSDKDEPDVWKKIESIYSFYYDEIQKKKLTTKQQ